MNSWSNQKASGAEDSLDAQHRSSSDQRNASTERQPVSKALHSVATYSTPHDIILSQLHGENQDPFASSSKLPDTEDPFIDSKATHYSQSRKPVEKASAGLLHDPYDGAVLGILLPPDLQPEQDSSVNGENSFEAYEPPTKLQDEYPQRNDEVWTNLSRVLDLQSHISKMHVDMEGIGPGKLGDAKAKAKAKGVNPTGGGDPDSSKTKPAPRPRRASVGVEGLGDVEGDDEGVGVGDEESEKKKAREMEFAKLADQFEGKKESINDIMGKLDDLSKALTEFHALQAPRIDFPNARHNSIGIKSPISEERSPSPPLIRMTPPLTQKQGPGKQTLWSLPNAGHSSPALLPGSLSRNPVKQRGLKLGQGVLEYEDRGRQSRLMESPVSTIGSLKLQP